MPSCDGGSNASVSKATAAAPRPQGGSTPLVWMRVLKRALAVEPTTMPMVSGSSCNPAPVALAFWPTCR
jgi:hypothetical protein